jgi:hypothetical protein
VATYELIVWRSIPAVVEARDQAGVVSRPLSDKFHMLIDSVAMQLGLEDSAAYLEQWSRSAPAERSGSAREVADAVAEELEASFPTFIGQAFVR